MLPDHLAINTHHKNMPTFVSCVHLPQFVAQRVAYLSIQVIKLCPILFPNLVEYTRLVCLLLVPLVGMSPSGHLLKKAGHGLSYPSYISAAPISEVQTIPCGIFDILIWYLWFFMGFLVCTPGQLGGT